MFEYKLQLGSLILTLYFVANYVKGTFDKKVTCNPLFDALLYLVPWAIVFDGATAWTVNHLETVPSWLNLLLHGLFFVSMAAMFIIIFLYMINQTVGISSKKTAFLCCLPGLVSILGIIFFLKDLYYIQGNKTNYSMGVSVIICYISLMLHYLTVLLLICIKYKTLERRKFISILFFLIIGLMILVVQVIFPESLVSSLFPAVAVAGIYMNFEDPASRRLQVYNEDMVTGFATLVENRDGNTGGHIRRTKGYVQIILEQMKKEPEYSKILTKDYVENVKNAAPMHDIGKISTPDVILQKPGKLTAEEYEIMKKHAPQGGKIIQKTFSDLQEPEYEKITYEVARFHHEKWNGKGYPDGLKGEEIPLHSRIMAIADVFDAVSAKRCYRDAMPIETCFKIIEEGVGVDFDPKLAKLFLNAKEEILEYIESDKEREIYEKWQEE